MKKFGVVSYNMYCNFTNYGSALQSWAMQKAINQLGKDRWEAVLIDYCPDILLDKDPLNPFSNMWDQDEESLRMCKSSMPAIKENYKKFKSFYNNNFKKTIYKYTSENFNEIVKNENLAGFVCGSDTIFCPDEFGMDDGYYANYECMKSGYTVSYAASFGDPNFTAETYEILNDRLQNFKMLGLRENAMIPYVKKKTNVSVERVIDPTLLFTREDYDSIAVNERLVKEKYICMYSRRYNPQMEAYVENLARQNSWKVVDISLRATNAEKGHIMFYNAGVEEFLSLIRHAEFVITNSYHGMIFSMIYSRPFYVFSREQCDTKIEELLELLGLSNRLKSEEREGIAEDIDYQEVHNRIAKEKERSLCFLNKELEACK